MRRRAHERLLPPPLAGQLSAPTPSSPGWVCSSLHRAASLPQQNSLQVWHHLPHFSCRCTSLLGKEVNSSPAKALPLPGTASRGQLAGQGHISFSSCSASCGSSPVLPAG